MNLIKISILFLLAAVYPLYLVINLSAGIVVPVCLAVFISISENQLTPLVVLLCYLVLWAAYGKVRLWMSDEYPRVSSIVFEAKWRN